MSKVRTGISRNKRLTVALRDGRAYRLWRSLGPTWLYRCCRCDRLIRGKEATAGHILPMAKGGSSAEVNLRLECELCNGLKNVARTAANPPQAAQNLETGLRAAWNTRRRKQGKKRVFDNVPVYFDGALLSYTCNRRAGHFLRTHRAVRSDDGAIHLLQPPRNSDPARDTPVENRCIRCGSEGPLRPHFIFPTWDPRRRSARPTDAIRPVCVNCFEVFDTIYAIEITRAAQEAIQDQCDAVAMARENKALVLQVWSRRRSGGDIPESVAAAVERVFQVDPRRASVEELRRVADAAGQILWTKLQRPHEGISAAAAGLDFLSLTNRIARRELDPQQLEIPAIDVRVRAKKTDFSCTEMRNAE